MSSLNLSANGPSISKSYQSIVDSPPPSGAAASSPTYGQWAVFAVQAPLVSAFQQDGGKESVLKVQSTGEGELVDLIDEFSDGRIQFAFAKVRDPNTSLPKNVLIAWCGEGVPERSKGYFTSHTAAVAKLLHGYHVQVTARSDRDLTPEGIVQKVADASGSKYSGGGGPPPPSATKPPVASKPVFTPTQSSGNTALNFTSRTRQAPSRSQNVDEDGWGDDAPQVTRTQLEKVPSAYQPTKVNMGDLTSQKPVASSYVNDSPDNNASGVVKGGYQPIGKVDIAALRREAKESGQLKDERPETVKGAYEPIGKVDIAAIRARAQKPSDAPAPAPSAVSPSATDDSEQPRSLAERSSAFTQPERLTSLPKPKVANKFGGGSSFTGTKAPAPGGFEAKPVAPAPMSSTSRTFADQGGKTPAQVWAEKKARERGASGSGNNITSPGFSAAQPVQTQASGDGGWKSGYTGKTWAPVQTTHTGKGSLGQQTTGEQEEAAEAQPTSPTGGVSSIRDRFSGTQPMGAPASTFDRAPPPEPALDTSNKPNRGIPIPGLPSQPVHEEEPAPSMPSPPPQPPRSPTPPTPEMRSASPIRVAMPVGRGADAEVADAHEEQMSPPPAMPVRSLQQTSIDDTGDDDAGADAARGAAQAAAASSFGAAAVEAAHPGAEASGKKALVQYDYAADEDNEITLREGEYITNIEQVDTDWWMGQNESGETGLFPSNYVEMVEDSAEVAAPPPSASAQPAAAEPAAPVGGGGGGGHTATAQFDYDAQEDNEISFPEGGKITNVVSFNVYVESQHIVNFDSRNSLMMTGGWESMEVSRVCSLQTMLS
ncbi:MAG: hypothetical protein Q9227_005410 [Pyrenula ochraceoflavens]